MHDQFHYLRHDAQSYFCSASVSEPFAIEIAAGTVAGDPLKPNEDRFGVRPCREGYEFLILDGATSLRPIPELVAIGMTGAEFASSTVLEAWYSSAPGRPGTAVLSELNRSLRSALTCFPSVDLDDPRYLPATTACLVQVNPETITVTNAGDSLALAQFRVGGAQLLTPATVIDAEVALLKRMCDLAALEHQPPRFARFHPEIVTALEAERVTHHNQPGGPAVLNGSPAFDGLLIERTVARTDVARIFIGTDGVVPPGLTRNDGDSLFQILLESSIVGLIHKKKSREDCDPDWHYPRFKHSDDATGILITLPAPAGEKLR